MFTTELLLHIGFQEVSASARHTIGARGVSVLKPVRVGEVNDGGMLGRWGWKMKSCHFA